LLIRAATRASPLALWQSERVAELLRASDPAIEVEVVVVHTSGDLDQTTPIEQMGGRGVFAKEVQSAVLDGRADIAVHSAKDLTSTPPDGLVIAAFPERADVRDGLVGGTLDGLRHGAVVATGSIRRKAQLAALRPDFDFVGLRGNMTTRLSKVGEVDAIVAACSGLDRIDLGHHIDDRLDPQIFVPQVGQGALAVECRVEDAAVCAAIAGIDDLMVRRTVSAERAYLAELGGGCDLPVGALASIDGEDVVLDALVSSFDGSRIVRGNDRGNDPTELGTAIARRLLAEGGSELLAER